MAYTSTKPSPASPLALANKTEEVVMPESNEQILQAEIVRLNKIIQALMNRAERNASVHGSDFSLFYTSLTLEDLVRCRTQELETAVLENERITRALRESENRHRLIVENAPISIHEIDMDGNILSMNRTGLLMRGALEESENQGTPYLNIASDSDRKRLELLLVAAQAGTPSHFEFKAKEVCGRIFKSCFVPIKNESGKVERILGLTEDITEQKKAEERICRLAFYDHLTQLPNRRRLHERLEYAITLGNQTGCYGAVMFLDLDNFKSLNDAYGHGVGDQLLIEAAHRLTLCVREIDAVARLGGDEFVVLLDDLGKNFADAVTRAGVVAQRIRAALAEPYTLPHKQVGEEICHVTHHCTSSIGIALFHGNDVRLEEILKGADTAMYQAKEDGRNTYRFFDPNSASPTPVEGSAKNQKRRRNSRSP
ncbi:MAG: sensor domain-containing diguanylate cyclase [Desulfobulbus sp.]|nr:sensor domain-containing diguanylate cyclase [Desulfobulbus sp.]